MYKVSQRESGMPLEFLTWAFRQTQFVASAMAFKMSNRLETGASSFGEWCSWYTKVSLSRIRGPSLQLISSGDRIPADNRVTHTEHTYNHEDCDEKNILPKRAKKKQR